ncbi:Sodium/calcium exchanger 3 [Trichoplax sp. H2]|nr:Sodium/calcium exchanger 3 [Trichoplax sp. H2]|eukprot:RDD45318.1 Sodium/calcium exchanger 3 [Trichoplax sp. H2]
MSYCNKTGLLLPILDESNWNQGFRGFLYLAGLLYSFLGVAIIADIFMCAIEVITSQTRRIKISDKDGNMKEVEVRIWNDTVANLTLMALGSSAPEILLSIIEIVGNSFKAGDLGPGTIVGSAAFNLLVITATCIVAIPNPEGRRIKGIKVFAVTATFSIFAYLWLYIVLVARTKNIVDLTEAIITLCFFFVLVLISYFVDRNFFCPRKARRISDTENGHLAFDDSTGRLVPDSFDKSSANSFLKAVKTRTDITAEEAAKLAAAKLQEQEKKSYIWYRVGAARLVSGSKRVTPLLDARLQKIFDDIEMKNKKFSSTADVRDDPETTTRTTIEFTTAACAVMENEKMVKVGISRTGKLNNTIKVRYETLPGTAEPEKDYIPQNDVLVFEPNEKIKYVTIPIVDDNEWEPDENFFIQIWLEGSYDDAIIGEKNSTEITIINDDEPGEIAFNKASYLFKESCGTAKVEIVRKNGSDGTISVNWKTIDGSAINGKDYRGGTGKIEFQHGEMSKLIEIPLIDDDIFENDETFHIELFDPNGGAKLGSRTRTALTIVNDDVYNSLLDKVVALTRINVHRLKLGSQSWGEQFTNAMTVNGGDVENATGMDYFLHFLTFGWKVIFAIIPPPSMLGGWLTFIASLGMIGFLTAIVGDLAGIFGCIVGLRDAVTAITFVALGTSLPDLFASKTAALNEKYADNSIGNVTGSNSVNVFLGLGLPWLIATIYWNSQNKEFSVPAGNLASSVILFTICAVICIALLMLRRIIPSFGGSELGGPTKSKYISGLLLVTLWIVYVIISSLQVYRIIPPIVKT